MKLYLIRHGDAVSEQADIKKPLSQKGKEETEKIAQLLQSKNITINSIWHSNKLRAIQTAQIVAQTLKVDNLIERNDLSPNDPVDKFPEEIVQFTKDLAIVGHLPFLFKLLSLLLTNKQNYTLADFKSSSVICLEYSNKEWIMKWFVTLETV